MSSHLYGVEPNYFFVLKASMKKHPIRVVLISFIVTLLVSAEAIRICER